MKREYNYTFTGEAKRYARAICANTPVSVKYATEVAREIKGKPVKKAEKLLLDIAEQRTFLPLKRFYKDVPHRKGTAQSGTKTGRFPKNCCRAWLTLLKSIRANADYKGMDSENLVIVHAFASHGFHRRSHQKGGHMSGKPHRRKSAHIEAVAMEAS